jgi:hypothetical protein
MDMPTSKSKWARNITEALTDVETMIPGNDPYYLNGDDIKNPTMSDDDIKECWFAIHSLRCVFSDAIVARGLRFPGDPTSPKEEQPRCMLEYLYE